MCEKCVFSKKQKRPPEPHLRTTDKTQILYFVVLWGPGSHSTKFRVWPRLNNYLRIMRFCAMRKCVCGECIKHMCRFFLIFLESQIRDAHTGRSDICIFRSQHRSTFISIYDRHCYCHCRNVRHCLCNSRENLNKLVMCNKRFNLVKCDTWAIRLYEITSCMGRYYEYCRGFIDSCWWPWFCRFMV